MEELADTLNLLGLPFLLTKAANAANDHEACGSPSTAAAFVEALKAVHEALKHPEAAAFHANTEQVLDINHLNNGPAERSMPHEQLSGNRSAPFLSALSGGGVESSTRQWSPVPSDSSSPCRSSTNASMASAQSHPESDDEFQDLERGNTPSTTTDLSETFATLSLAYPSDAGHSDPCSRQNAASDQAEDGERPGPTGTQWSARGTQSPMESPLNSPLQLSPDSVSPPPCEDHSNSSGHSGQVPPASPRPSDAEPAFSTPESRTHSREASCSASALGRSGEREELSAFVSCQRDLDSGDISSLTGEERHGAVGENAAPLPHHGRRGPTERPGQSPLSASYLTGLTEVRSTCPESPSQQSGATGSQNNSNCVPPLGASQAEVRSSPYAASQTAMPLPEEHSQQAPEELPESSKGPWRSIPGLGHVLNMCQAPPLPELSTFQPSTNVGGTPASALPTTDTGAEVGKGFEMPASQPSDADEQSPLVPQSTVRKAARQVFASDDEEPPIQKGSQILQNAIDIFDQEFLSAVAGTSASDGDGTKRSEIATKLAAGLSSTAKPSPCSPTEPSRRLPHEESTHPALEADRHAEARDDDSDSVILLSSDSEDECMVETGLGKFRGRCSALSIDSDAKGHKENVPSTPQQPTPKDTPAKRRGFLPVLTPASGKKQQAPTALPAANFKRARDILKSALFIEFNEKVFGNQLPQNLEITWNKNLKTTAGLTYYERKLMEGEDQPRYLARLELSSKVVDSLERLRHTLLHEMCHVAAWMLDHTAKPPHGPKFKRWADRAMARYPDMEVSTCHQFEIYCPFQWQCTNEECGKIVKRHSNSIDVAKKVCGSCKSRLLYLGRMKPDGTPAAVRKPTQYSIFFQENYSKIKEQFPKGTPQGVIFKSVATQWHTEKDKARQADANTEGRSPMRRLDLSDLSLH